MTYELPPDENFEPKDSAAEYLKHWEGQLAQEDLLTRIQNNKSETMELAANAVSINGDLDKAREVYNELLEAKRRLLGLAGYMHPEIGWLVSGQIKYEKLILGFEQALTIIKAQLGSGLVNEASPLLEDFGHELTREFDRVYEIIQARFDEINAA